MAGHHLSLPPRWLHCPRKGQIIAGKFLPFKTMLDARYNQNIPEEYRFQLPMLMAYVNSQQAEMKMIIDLTNTSRFYDKGELEENSIAYMKLRCQGRDESPTPEQVKTFISVADNFFSKHPEGILGVHCTHGFNRTGFLIVAYLVERMEWSLEAAVHAFAQARFPGIYKEDYLRDLCKHYGGEENDLVVPEHPGWYKRGNDIDADDGDIQTKEDDVQPRGKKRKMPSTKFVDGVDGVFAVEEMDEINRLQTICQEMCQRDKKGFPGSQPVSMDTRNVVYLLKTPYRVSWKADGTRYLMLILGKGKVYMFDRDNTVFATPQFTFPHRQEPDSHISNTLIDGEMVFDREGKHNVARYLMYDIIKFENKDVGKADHETRLSCIQKEIIEARAKAEAGGKLDKSKEPFRIRAKQFWDVSQTEKVLKNVVPLLGHENDGLIFSPGKEQYIAGQCASLLKWKPPELNSVDFRLRVVRENKLGELPRTFGQLFVGGHPSAVSELALTKDTKQLDGKIVECMWNAAEQKWKFMRVRDDKTFPNNFRTAKSVCESIEQPLTKDSLLKVIADRIKALEYARLGPPPSK